MILVVCPCQWSVSEQNSLDGCELYPIFFGFLEFVKLCKARWEMMKSNSINTKVGYVEDGDGVAEYYRSPDSPIHCRVSVNTLLLSHLKFVLWFNVDNHRTHISRLCWCSIDIDISHIDIKWYQPTPTTAKTKPLNYIDVIAIVGKSRWCWEWVAEQGKEADHEHDG